MHSRARSYYRRDKSSSIPNPAINDTMISMLVQFLLDRNKSENRPLQCRAPVLENLPGGTVALAGSARLRSMTSGKDDLARSLLAAYRQRGSDFLSDIVGEFALVIRLHDENRTLIALDRMGVESFAWSLDGGILTLGTSAADVARHANPEHGASINQQTVFNFMLCHMVPAPDTVFENVRKLLPATALEFQDQRHREFRYWQPHFDRTSQFDETRARDQFLPTLEAAVKRTEPDRNTGSFLSGGLDSSTVTGLLGKVSAQPANAFSIGFGVAEFNELEYAKTASAHFGCKHQVYEVTADDVVQIIPKIASGVDEPFGNSSAVPTFTCARLASEHGITHLLAGDGGDELYGGNEHYNRHSIFEKFWRLPQPLRSHVLSPVADWLDPETSLYPLRKFSSYVRQARIRLPDRFESWNMIYREGPARVFSGDFLDAVDPDQPMELMRSVWSSCPGTDLLDKMLWYDWKYTLADNDLRKVMSMCKLAGIRVSFPMLDAEFVDLSVTVPSGVKIKNGNLRSFFKDAVRDFLPPAVVNKTKHGFGLPFGHWLKTHAALRDLVYDSIGTLRKRAIFHEAFLDRVLDEHKSGDAGYYGYAIWDLVMLEQWLAAQAPGYRR